MNDFTKEELEAIHYDLETNENPWQCGETIIKKLKRLIDNYCDHEWDNYYEGSINLGIFCNKCHRKLRGS